MTARFLRKPALRGLVLLFSCAPALASGSAFAAELRIAVAANFAAPAETLATLYEAETGTKVSISSGASGALFAQITQGAPFDLFLSADAARPERLEAEGFALTGSRFTYALGKLVLWSAEPELVDGAGAVLESGVFAHLSIANPESAPYGTAAIAAMEALGVLQAIRPKLVIGQSVAQAFQFIESGNAELGFIALSQLGPDAGGSRWEVPAELYPPIRQDAVIIRNDPDAEAFAHFLKSAEGA